MTIEIDINNYLTKEQIAEIAEQEIRYSFRNQMSKEGNIERILTNLSYEYVFKIVEEELNIHKDEFKMKLKETIIKVLDDSSTLRYEIFRRADAWGRTESPAVRYLEEVLIDSKNKIVEEVNKRIEEYPFYELKENILDTIYYCIENMLTKKKKEEINDL